MAISAKAFISTSVASSIRVGVVKHPFNPGEKTLHIRPENAAGKYQALSDEQKAFVKDVRGSRNQFFTWNSSTKTYSASYCEDLETLFKQLNAALEARLQAEPEAFEQAAPATSDRPAKGNAQALLAELA